MNRTKHLIRTIVSKMGYQLTKIEHDNVRFSSFINLAINYESYVSDKYSIELPDNQQRYSLLAKLQGTPPSEAYEILFALQKCAALDGDICEFGVAEGETSALIANEILNTERSLHLFDSFEGLPAPTVKDELIDDVLGLGSIQAYEGRMSFPEASVKKRLAAIDFPLRRTHLHKGFVDTVFRRNIGLPKKVSVAYVDFDFYQPILDALNFLDPILQLGGVVVVDDYGFFSSGAKKAVDEWLDNINRYEERYIIRIPNEPVGKFAILEKFKMKAQG